MKEELTTAMHSEFTVSEKTEKEHRAFSVFTLVSEKTTLTEALDIMEMTLEDVSPFVDSWNQLSTKQIILE